MNQLDQPPAWIVQAEPPAAHSGSVLESFHRHRLPVSLAASTFSYAKDFRGEERFSEQREDARQRLALIGEAQRYVNALAALPGSEEDDATIRQLINARAAGGQRRPLPKRG